MAYLFDKNYKTKLIAMQLMESDCAAILAQSGTSGIRKLLSVINKNFNFRKTRKGKNIVRKSLTKVDDDKPVRKSLSRVEKIPRDWRLTKKEVDNRRLSGTESKSIDQLNRITGELVKTEESYVNQLKDGIKRISRQPSRLLKSIKEIYKLHEDFILPNLKKPISPSSIASLVIKLIDDNKLTCYLDYSRGHKAEANHLIEREHSSVDKMELGSFLIKPIQRIPRYQLLIENMIEELTKNEKKNQEILKVCKDALNKLKEFLKQLNNAI
jgi:hypothetical protein